MNMSTANWKDEYTVNVNEIDRQHKKMINLVTNIHVSVESRIDKDKLKILLNELVEYTRMHFSTEDKLMKKYAYPKFKKHHKEHKLLLKYLDQLVKAIEKGKHPTFYSDYDISSDWAIIHINDHDKELAVFLNSKNVY